MRSSYLRIHKALSERYPTDVIVSAGMKGNAGFVARCVIVEEGSGRHRECAATGDDGR